MKYGKISKSVYSLKYSFTEFFSQNKIKLLICLIFCLIGLFTGVFTAIKVFNMGELDIFESFNLTYKLSDLENFSSNFFNRLLSYELVILLLFVFSLHPLLYLFGWCLIAYRAFLVSINCVMIVLIFSFNGIIKGVLIIFPCQLVMLAIMIVYFCFMSKQINDEKVLKHKGYSNIIFTILLASICLTVVNLVETLLLFLFRSNVILVIWLTSILNVVYTW